MCLAPRGPRTSPAQGPLGPWYVCRLWLHCGPDAPGALLPAFPASHPGGDVDGVHALGQGALQVLQRVQALHLAAAAVDELPEGVLLEQGLHVLQEEALTEQGQFRGVVDLWGQGEGVRPTGQGLGEACPVSAA